MKLVPPSQTSLCCVCVSKIFSYAHVFVNALTSSPQAADSEADRLSTFFSRNTYVSGKYSEESSFSALHTHLLTLPGGAEANRLFYLALPPTVYHDVTKNIKHHCMCSKLVHNSLIQYVYMHTILRVFVLE